MFQNRIYGPHCPGKTRPIEQAAGYVMSHYRWFRARNYPAVESYSRALCLAPSYVKAREYYPRSGIVGAIWESHGDKLRWIERPQDIGLRFIGFSDELVNLNHNGWYTSEDGWTGETLRGGVWQLPGKRGRTRLMYGYIESQNPKAAAIAWTIYETESEDSALRYNETVQDCARWGDRLAESIAGQERDYESAYQSGARAGRADCDAKEARRQVLPLLADYRAARASAPESLLSLALEAIRARLERIKESRAARLDDWPNIPKRLESAFRDGFECESDWRPFAVANRLPLQESE